MHSSTIGEQMENQDREAFLLLQRLIERPALFVGTTRFDYIDFLFRGYCMGTKSDLYILPNSEVQYWLLHTQSASLHGTITGTTLFYRCFGTGLPAFEKYKEFLKSDILENLSCVDDELYAYEKKYDIVRYDWENDVPVDHYKKLAQGVYDNIQAMIAQTDFTYDRIKVYVRKERLFNQVRFLLHGDYGWVDDSQIISRPECHKFLIAIHANVRNTTTEDLRACGYDVFDDIKYDDDVLPMYDAFTDSISFSSEFTSWKEQQL